MNKATTEPAYNYKVVRQFAIMTVVWGVIGMGLGVLIASQLVWPQMNFDLPWTSFGRLRAAAYQPGDLRLRRLRAVRHQLLHGAAHLPGTPVLRHPGRLHLLGLAGGGGDPAGQPAAGQHHHQGIRRDRVHRRDLAGDRLGRLRGGVLRHPDQAQGQAHLCRQLVLRLVHPDHRDAAHRQPHVAAGELVQVLLDVLRRHRCHGPVVVRAQRRRLLP